MERILEEDASPHHEQHMSYGVSFKYNWFSFAEENRFQPIADVVENQFVKLLEQRHFFKKVYAKVTLNVTAEAFR
jgi:hypothetical protein